MLTDTTGIRHLARRLRERADEIRAEAARVRRRADAVPWQGLAADAMRAHVAVRARPRLRATASLHDDAAEALDRHAGRRSTPWPTWPSRPATRARRRARPTSCGDAVL